MSRIVILTAEFQISHGRAPRGYGAWMFEIGGRKVDYVGTYGEACKRARQYAKNIKVTVVKLLP